MSYLTELTSVGTSIPQDHRDALSETVVDWALSLGFSDLNIEVVDRIRLALLDTAAGFAIGTDAEGVDALQSLARTWGGDPVASAVGLEQRVPAHVAALVNATAARAWDVDDVLEHAYCHISVTVVPVLLALADRELQHDRHITGEHFITALAAGLETTSRLALAPLKHFSVTGAAKSYECGTFGAVIGAARLLGMSRDETMHAVGLALAALCGKQQGYLAGSHSVRVSQGLSGQAAVMAVDMALAGVTGIRPGLDALTGMHGYFPTVHRSEFDETVVSDGLGKRWRFLETSIKPLYPCCKFTHTSLEATIQAISELDCSPRDIAEIIVDVTDPQVRDLVCTPEAEKRRPSSQASAQFSLPYVLGVAALDNRVSPLRFHPEALANEELLAMVDCVTIRHAQAKVDTQVGAHRPMPGRVTVRLRDGREQVAEVSRIHGHPELPMTFADVAEKFASAVEFSGRTTTRVDEILVNIRELESSVSAGRLSGLLCE